MINELFAFQKQAVNDLRSHVAVALNNYRQLKVPQVVSLQAPTGSGKSLICIICAGVLSKYYHKSFLFFTSDKTL